jgi:hypothetical protein
MADPFLLSAPGGPVSKFALDVLEDSWKLPDELGRNASGQNCLVGFIVTAGTATRTNRS